METLAVNAATLRPQCAACPWSDMAWMHANAPSMVAAAEQGHDDWHCHKRMGPCDGPRHAGVQP